MAVVGPVAPVGTIFDFRLLAPGADVADAVGVAVDAVGHLGGVEAGRPLAFALSLGHCDW